MASQCKPSALLRRLRPDTVLALLLLFAALLYARTLNYGFVYDDISQITLNPRIESWSNLPSFFTQHLWAHNIPAANGNYYRPLLLVWMLINHSLFGNVAVGWHATSLLVQLLAAVLLFRTMLALGAGNIARCIATALFLFHPLAVQSTVWISDVNDPLCLVFLLASFLAYLSLRQHSRWLRTAISIALFALAMLTKESAIAFVAIIFFHQLITSGLSFRQSLFSALRSSFPFAIAASAYLVLRHAVLGATILRAPAEVSLPTALLTLPSVLVTHLKHLFAPTQLAVIYHNPYVTTASPRDFWFPLLIVFAVFVVLVLLWRRSRSPLFLFGIIWAIVFLLPSLAGVAHFRNLGLVHDRYFYASLAGVAIAVGSLLEPVVERSRLALAASLAVLALLAGVSLLQQPQWKSDEALFTRATQVSPEAPQAWLLLASVRYGQHRLGEAASLMERCLALDPRSFSAHLLRARIALDSADHATAERHLATAIELHPDRAEPHWLLATLRFSQSRDPEGFAELKTAIALFPNNIEYRLRLASAHRRRMQLPEALAEYKAILQLAPNEVGLQNTISDLESRLASSKP